MYNIFDYFKVVRSSRTLQYDNTIKFPYRPLPSKNEPVDCDTPVPHKPMIIE